MAGVPNPKLGFDIGHPGNAVPSARRARSCPVLLSAKKISSTPSPSISASIGGTSNTLLPGSLRGHPGKLVPVPSWAVNTTLPVQVGLIAKTSFPGCEADSSPAAGNGVPGVDTGHPAKGVPEEFHALR